MRSSTRTALQQNAIDLEEISACGTGAAGAAGPASVAGPSNKFAHLKKISKVEILGIDGRPG